MNTFSTFVLDEQLQNQLKNIEETLNEDAVANILKLSSKLEDLSFYREIASDTQKISREKFKDTYTFGNAKFELLNKISAFVKEIKELYQSTKLPDLKSLRTQVLKIQTTVNAMSFKGTK